MAKVKVVKTNLNGNLNGDYFNDTPSNTIFSFGKFFVTSNFDGKTTVDYTNSLSSFVNGVTLETLGVTEVQSKIIDNYSTNAILNLDKSNLNTFVRYGSAYEFLRVSIQNIILAYPGSLFANSQKDIGGTDTFSGFSYNAITNISTFYVPTACTVNTFGLVFNDGNSSVPDDNELKNLNDSFEKYVIWSKLEPNTLYPIIGYTGNTVNSSDYFKQHFLKLQVLGNPFSLIGSPSGLTSQDFHIRPNNLVFEEFRALLNSYEQNIVSERDGIKGFNFKLKDPTLLENGKIVYSDSQVLWATADGYNIDVNTPEYQRLLQILLTIGIKYDKIKTDLIARFLTPTSLKTYDFTEDGKITKLLRTYGWEFDQIRQFIDSLVNINKVTYDKLNNIPDQLIKNLARTFGWDYFSLVNENELVESFLTIDDTERNLNESLLPAEIDVELWRRILNNTNYFWKSKGTREAIKSMFLLIGIPEPFINITEYVYTVEGKINPNTVPLLQEDFPSNSLPYDTEGYPVAPLETNDFYFQVSGDTDSGQAYLDVFRMAGFNLKQTADNKKSWVQTGATTRIHNTTPQYYQEDSKLVINTKEIDIALDTARGIEFDVYEYIQKDFAANSSGYTLPYSYVNLSLGVEGTQSTFNIPSGYNNQGDFEVRYNGILLNAPKSGTTSGITYQADYTIDYSANTFTITNPAYNIGNRRDVIQVTLVNSGTTTSAVTGITVQYVVTRVKANITGTYIPLPSYPRGDIQVTINGVALTKGTSQFAADYILDPANTTGSSQIIIQNPDVITYLNSNPDVQIAYLEVEGSNDINVRSEIVRVDSFNTSKIYFNNSANKYVYKLNYKVNDASEIKFLIDGIALEPYMDYNINVQNPYEVFLPKGIRYGTVISAYYLVGGNGAFNPVINDVFGLGDISELSFLEFLELVQRKMINARNRQTVTDFKGGWYPAVLAIYEKYLKRSFLPNNNPLQSNGYTFLNLYPFLSKYNAFFQKFVDQLLSATIIQKRGGLLIRNTIFTKQKHWYKRGVNFDYNVNYFGDDGSTFLVLQPTPPPPPPVPPVLYVQTTVGILGSLLTGGNNIQGYDVLTEYGIDYKRIDYPYPYGGGSEPIGLQNLVDGIDFETEPIGDEWTRISEFGSLPTDSFSMTLVGLDYEATYSYRAFVQSDEYGYTGETLQITTPPEPVVPKLDTKVASSATQTTIESTGGVNIVYFGDADYHGMEYRRYNGWSWDAWTLYPIPPTSTPLSVNNWTQNIIGLIPDSTYQYRAFMEVTGVTYYGNTRQIHTPAIPLVVPSVTTGLAANVSENGFDVDNNIINSKGYPETILEYGILYTQSSTYGTPANLTLDIDTTYIKIQSTSSDYIGTYSGITSGLVESTTTYYRAFARNSTGAAYGAVKTIETDGPIYVYLNPITDNGTTPDNLSSFSAKIETSRPLVAGQCFNLTYTACAVSSTPIPLTCPISANACASQCGGTCGCADSNIAAGICPYGVTCTDSGSDTLLMSSCSSYAPSTYNVCVKACSNACNHGTNYCNNARICLTSISAACCGNYILGCCGSTALYAYNTTVCCCGSGGG